MYPNVHRRMPYSKSALPRYEIYHCLITLYALLLVPLFARLDHQLVNTRLCIGLLPLAASVLIPSSSLSTECLAIARSSSAALCHEAWPMPAPWGGWRDDGGAAAARPLIGRAGRHCVHLSLLSSVTAYFRFIMDQSPKLPTSASYIVSVVLKDYCLSFFIE